MQKKKRLRSKTKEVVVNIYDYFKELSRHKSMEWTSDATGISCTTINRLWKEKVDIGDTAFQLQQRNTDSLGAC